MSINSLRKLAGLTDEYTDLKILDEAVKIPVNASHEHVMTMLDAAKHALELVKKLPNKTEEDKKAKEKHRSRVRRGLEKIIAHLAAMKD